MSHVQQIEARAIGAQRAPAAAPRTPFREVLLVGGIPDQLNRNLSIRDCVAEALGDRLGTDSVRVAGLPRGVERLDDMREAFVLIFGSAMADESDFYAVSHEARRRGFPVVMWLTDDPYEFDAAYKFVDLADYVFTNDRWTATYYRHPRVFHLPMAASHGQHLRPVIENDADYAWDIFFCGVGFANRRAIIDGLAPVLSRHDAYICGAEWEENAPYVHNRRLSNHELCDHYQRSRIVLNLARDFSYANDQFHITPSTPGPRTFEAALAGGFQMIFADRPEVTDYFAPDREIVMFSGLEDFREKVEYYLANPQARIETARAAQQRALRDHLFVHRVDRMLDRMRETGPATRAGAGTARD